mmetsp:Transcript_7109/g.27237  ORF Transcript_7109/g.27237 Transcript_7109/m.27237 type:complete len:504 (-) Transcript_7109:214-1725(-)|eukprot:scaffold959_cov258-Pinguiococcus_pyrenoidosus.AAC.2
MDVDHEEEEYEYEYSDDDEQEYEYSTDDGEDAKPASEKISSSLRRHSSLIEMEYSIIATSELRCLMSEMLAEICPVLEISQEGAYHLMSKFGWDREKLYNKYYEGTSDLKEELGISDLSIPPVEGPDSITCRICYEEVPPSEAVQLACKHAFCVDCYGGYLNNKIGDGPAAVYARCPEAKCNCLVPEALFQRLLTPDNLRKYERYLLSSFVDISKNMRWCPAPNCDKAARGDGAVKDVSCDCGRWFCFKCGEDAHSPASCDHLALWQEKCQNESETANWIIANTKKCPQCQTRIEKNQGCNHMTCSRCKHEFCWICMGSWSDHGTATGGYYKCNRFDANNASVDQKESDRAKRELDRYLHYYQRYHGHHSGENFAKTQQDHLDQRMAELQETSAASTWIDVQYLKIAQEQLIECRRVLKYTYVYGYYMRDGTSEKELFEHHQQNLEKFTEHLSGLTEKKPQDIDRTEVVNYTRVTNRYLRNLLKAIDEGLDGDMDEGKEAKGP